jgi:hypothetical protein
VSDDKVDFTELVVTLGVMAILLGLVWNLWGLIIGAAHAPRRNDNVIKGCDYTSIAQYTPGYALACELFRYRGPKESSP